MKKHLNIKVYGRVQGVIFRHSTMLKAKALNLTGLVRNEPDDSIYIEAEGEEDNLNKLLEWCKEGPPLASVEKVDYKFSPELKNYDTFEIE